MVEVDEPEELYTVAPDEFIAARNELVKRLRAEKRREEAAEVAKLRRPSTSAWALNQVARQQPALIEDALAAGARLREATDAAVGGNAAGLRQATADDRAAADAVVDTAASLLGRQASRPQLASTLRAAVLDQGVADELRRGVLTADHDAAGFGFGDGLGAGALAPTPRTKTKTTAKAPAEKRSATADPGQAKAEAEADRRSTKEAEDRAREERRRHAELAAQVKRLEKRADRMARDAERAEAEARQARADADAAAAEADTARRELDEG